MPKSQKDPNLIFRFAYDDAEEALRTIPSSNSSFAIELDADDGDSVETRSKNVANAVLQSAISATSGDTSSSADISAYSKLYVSIIGDSLDTADATVQLQASSDDTNFADVGGAIVTLASGATVNHIIVENAPYAFFRLVYVEGTNTTGTVTTQYNLKG